MSPVPAPPPNRRTLALMGATALGAAGLILVFGLMDRAQATRDLQAWNAEQAVPTVALAAIGHSDAPRPLTLPGTIQPYIKAPIYARVSGYLKSWNEDIGAHVKAGQLLATIDTPDLDEQLEQAKADLAKARADSRLADLTARRWQALVASQSVSQQAADEKLGDADAKRAQTAAAQANVHRLEALESFKRITAPFDGIVTARTTDIGALINAGAGAAGSGGATRELFEVSDMRRIRLYMEIPQAFAADLKPGMTATFDMPQYPGRTFTATLVTTANAVKENSRTMQVELQADNPDGLFSAGAYCEVHFTLPTDPHSVEVPATALIIANDGVRLAVLGQDGKVSLKPVQLGRDFGDTVEVLSGVGAADRVIDSPPETLQGGDVARLVAGDAPAAGAGPKAKAD